MNWFLGLCALGINFSSFSLGYLLGYRKGVDKSENAIIDEKEDKYIQETPLEWIPISDRSKLENDANYLVVNEKVLMLPARAYYCTEWDAFLSFDNDLNIPIQVTHYMKMPKNPGKHADNMLQ